MEYGTTIYLYDPNTLQYIGEDAYSENHEIQSEFATYFTETKPPQFVESEFICIYKDGSWKKYYRYSYVLDEDDTITSKIDFKKALHGNDCLIAIENDSVLVFQDEATCLDIDIEDLTKRHKVKNSIHTVYDVTGLLEPVWDKTEFVEGQSEEVELASIDAKTSDNIHDWCVEQGKCEKNYLNLGLDDNTNAQYLAYKAQRSMLIAEGAAKKIIAKTKKRK